MASPRGGISEIILSELIITFLKKVWIPLLIGYIGWKINEPLILLVGTILIVVILITSIRSSIHRNSGTRYPPCFIPPYRSVHKYDIKEFGVTWPVYVSEAYLIEELVPDLFGQKNVPKYLGKPRCPVCHSELKDRDLKLFHIWSCPKPECKFRKITRKSFCEAKEEVEKIHIEFLG